MKVNTTQYTALCILIASFPNAIAQQPGYKSCGYDLKILWTAEVSHTPFAATPLITDVDGDNRLDIVATPFAEEIEVLKGEDGTVLADSNWPYHLADRTVLASPLQYDISGDGMLDILIITTDGEMMFFTPKGQLINNATYKLEPLYVQKDWFKKQLSLSKTTIHDYILDEPPSSKQETHVAVDPHVMATPVITDVNNDGRIEELVIPVSYYYDTDHYNIMDRDVAEMVNVSYDNMNNYLSGAIVVFNLTKLQPVKIFHLELTKKLAEYPGYVLFTPTVIDLDGEHGLREIIVGTSAGNVHVFDINGRIRPGFPRAFDTIHGQITVADVNEDGQLELIVIDTSANVECMNRDGKTVWEATLSGSSSSGSRVADIDGDGHMEVLITTNDGKVWALKGSTGEKLPKWPLKIATKLTANILITRLSAEKVVLVAVTDDGFLHLYSGTNSCVQSINLGESALVQVLSHDLVRKSDGLELLVAGKDGTLICLGARLHDRDLHEKFDLHENALFSWPSETHGANGFTFEDGKTSILLSDDTKNLHDMVGATFPVNFLILDERKRLKSPSYNIQILFGSKVIGQQMFTSAGRWSIDVKVPTHPAHGHLTVRMTNQHGQIFTDCSKVRFNSTFLEELEWLLYIPFVTMVIILLLLHGFPTADLLPVTQRSKAK